MQEGKMKRLGVVMLISSFHPLIGGAERQAQQLAARLTKAGINVWVLTRRYEGLESYEEVDGVPVYRVPIISTGLVAALSYILFALLWLFRNRGGFQILHCHTPLSSATIGVIGKCLWKKKVMVKIARRGIQDMPLPSIRSRLLHLTDLFIILNEESRVRLRDAGLGDVPLQKIPNGVDVDKFSPVSPERKSFLRDRLGIPQSSKVTVFTGRLHPQKGLDTLFSAWQKLLPSTENARLLVLGEGLQKTSLRALARQLDVEDSVFFLASQDDVVEYLQAADVFVLPSLSEGLSNSLLEAMACGLAVVATCVEGSNEVVVDKQNGLLVPPKEVDGLANALILVLNHGEIATKLGHAARNRVVEMYSLESVTAKYVELYQRLAANERGYEGDGKENGCDSST